MSYPTSEHNGQQWGSGYPDNRFAGGEPPLFEAWYGATFPQAVTRFFRKTFHFRGYASLSEFWWIQLGLIVVNLALMGLLRAARGNSGSLFPSVAVAIVSAIVWLIQIVLLVAQLSLVWRRFHDTGRSGAFFFVAFVPIVGTVAAAILLAMPTAKLGRRDEWTDIGQRPTTDF